MGDLLTFSGGSINQEQQQWHFGKPQRRLLEDEGPLDDEEEEIDESDVDEELYYDVFAEANISESVDNAMSVD